MQLQCSHTAALQCRSRHPRSCGVSTSRNGSSTLRVVQRWCVSTQAPQLRPVSSAAGVDAAVTLQQQQEEAALVLLHQQEQQLEAWEDFKDLFSQSDEHGSLLDALCCQLEAAVAAEDYAAAASLKAEILDIISSDPLSDIHRQLQQALQDEDYSTVARLRNEGWVWLEGWWASDADGAAAAAAAAATSAPGGSSSSSGSAGAAGHLLRIAPEYGRLTGKVYSAQDLAIIQGLMDESVAAAAYAPGALDIAQAAAATARVVSSLQGLRQQQQGSSAAATEALLLQQQQQQGLVALGVPLFELFVVPADEAPDDAGEQPHQPQQASADASTTTSSSSSSSASAASASTPQQQQQYVSKAVLLVDSDGDAAADSSGTAQTWTLADVDDLAQLLGTSPIAAAAAAGAGAGAGVPAAGVSVSIAAAIPWQQLPLNPAELHASLEAAAAAADDALGGVLCADGVVRPLLRGKQQQQQQPQCTHMLQLLVEIQPPPEGCQGALSRIRPMGGSVSVAARLVNTTATVEGSSSSSSSSGKQPMPPGPPLVLDWSQVPQDQQPVTAARLAAALEDQLVARKMMEAMDGWWELPAVAKSFGNGPEPPFAKLSSKQQQHAAAAAAAAAAAGEGGQRGSEEEWRNLGDREGFYAAVYGSFGPENSSTSSSSSSSSSQPEDWVLQCVWQRSEESSSSSGSGAGRAADADADTAADTSARSSSSGGRPVWAGRAAAAATTRLLDRSSSSGTESTLSYDPPSFYRSPATITVHSKDSISIQADALPSVDGISNALAVLSGSDDGADAAAAAAAADSAAQVAAKVAAAMQQYEGRSVFVVEVPLQQRGEQADDRWWQQLVAAGAEQYSGHGYDPVWQLAAHQIMVQYASTTGSSSSSEGAPHAESMTSPASDSASAALGTSGSSRSLPITWRQPLADIMWHQAWKVLQQYAQQRQEQEQQQQEASTETATAGDESSTTTTTTSSSANGSVADSPWAALPISQQQPLLVVPLHTLVEHSIHAADSAAAAAGGTTQQGTGSTKQATAAAVLAGSTSGTKGAVRTYRRLSNSISSGSSSRTAGSRRRGSSSSSSTDVLQGYYLGPVELNRTDPQVLQLQMGRCPDSGRSMLLGTLLTGSSSQPAGRLVVRADIGPRADPLPVELFPRKLGVKVRYPAEIHRVAAAGGWHHAELLRFKQRPSSASNELTDGAELGLLWQPEGSEKHCMVLLHRIEFEDL